MCGYQIQGLNEYLDAGLFRSLLEIFSRSLIRLPDGNVLYANAAVGLAMKLAVSFIIEIFGKIFCRRINGCEWLKIVHHLMIEPVDDMSDDLAQVLEVQQQTRFVQFLAGQRDPHLVVMSVRVLALAFVVAQIMACGKRVLDRDLKH